MTLKTETINIKGVYTDSEYPINVEVLDRDINATSAEEELNQIENELDTIRTSSTWRAVW